MVNEIRSLTEKKIIRGKKLTFFYSGKKVEETDVIGLDQCKIYAKKQLAKIKIMKVNLGEDICLNYRQTIFTNGCQILMVQDRQNPERWFSVPGLDLRELLKEEQEIIKCFK